MTITSPLIKVMIESICRASKPLARDFHEINKLRSSRGISSFLQRAQSRSKEIIYDGLMNYRKNCDFLFIDNRDVTIKDDYTGFIAVMDGQANFINAINYFSLSILFLDKKKAIAAVIDAPILQEIFWVEKENGVFMEDPQSHIIPIRNKSKQGLNGAFADCYNIKGSLLNKLLLNGVNVRLMGSALLSFAYVAAERFDALICGSINEHKTAIGKLFLQESRGKVSINDNLLIAGNPNLCDSLEDKLKQTTVAT
ncbi:MAG: inositol monophosphatase [Candidatus Mesenet longicola]|uniref:Inositol monophosphatase n=1 Tax=Candidatus Mesenet longicola TaxID=1892558 RepID=A0A8J3HPQ7_9RICK|nr:MAG: inositol monophosphatase [Candidatus Mesenet longicola]GHM59571.1 MAG: inositol monophosphatase [Candidatus Mesenet longicola]